MLSSLKRIGVGIRRKVAPNEADRRREVIKNPPEIEPNSIVFVSTDDFSDNPRALYEYMLEHGYNEKYKMTWIFEFAKNYRTFDEDNVYSIKMYDDKGQRTEEAQRTIMSAQYVFFSHNVNWAKNFDSDQTYVCLWHGNGYKAKKESEKRTVMFDYCTVVGDKYAEALPEYYGCRPEQLLPLGYPRNDWFHTDKSNAGNLIDKIKHDNQSDKLIMWLPTFRKSKVERLSSQYEVGALGLPLINDEQQLEELNDQCRKNRVTMVLKQHVLQKEYELPELSNIVCIDNTWIEENGSNLYEMLAKSDALLTDYSSVGVDYMLLDKPIGYILDDFDAYEKDHGWCLENVKNYMAGNHIYSIEDLTVFIEEIASGKDMFREHRNEIKKELHNEAESYCERIINYFNL